MTRIGELFPELDRKKQGAPPIVRKAYPSPAEVIAARTPAGGWTRAQLAAWGIEWPPPKGWKKMLERRYAEKVERSK